MWCLVGGIEPMEQLRDPEPGKDPEFKYGDLMAMNYRFKRCCFVKICTEIIDELPVPRRRDLNGDNIINSLIICYLQIFNGDNR